MCFPINSNSWRKARTLTGATTHCTAALLPTKQQAWGGKGRVQFSSWELSVGHSNFWLNK